MQSSETWIKVLKFQLCCWGFEKPRREGNQEHKPKKIFRPFKRFGKQILSTKNEFQKKKFTNKKIQNPVNFQNNDFNQKREIQVPI